ncbi:hypothetical protein C3489_06115 [Streptomyces sp. Ru71]|uniref:DUF6585 family protein n=1 Tax=Streptomyces sp. Ru71 TaxID=2080746 RepID=UPI000CDD086E|nr:DUF6585 family protein [Streptomyces sp. Ru71]POX56292.1 hypothetical protein C3489_06115 [Streptomyces sp. Ru71]
MARSTAQQDPGRTAAHQEPPPGTEGLGQLWETFLPQRAGTVRLATLLLMGTVSLILPPLGAYFFWLAAQTPNLSRRQAARRLHLFEHGLAEVGRNGEVSVFRWDSMTVLQEITERYANGVYVGTTYVYTLYREDGTTLKVTGFYAQPERWGPAIQQEITRAQLPGLLAGLERGGTLAYGELSVNLGGVATPKGSLTWPEVDSAELSQGVLVLRRAGKKLPWARIPVKKIPNLCLFLALVDRLRHGGPRQGF